MTPYESLYGRKCRFPICSDDVGERKHLSLNLIQLTTEKIRLIQEKLKTSQIQQKKKKSMQATRGKNLNFKWVIMSS